MSIDRQRVAAVNTLIELGYTWNDGKWSKPTPQLIPVAVSSNAHNAQVTYTIKPNVSFTGHAISPTNQFANDAYGAVNAALYDMSHTFLGVYGRAPVELRMPDWSRFVTVMENSPSYPRHHVRLANEMWIQNVRLREECP